MDMDNEIESYLKNGVETCYFMTLNSRQHNFVFKLRGDVNIHWLQLPYSAASCSHLM